MKLGIIGSYDITHNSVCGQSDKTELFLQFFNVKLGKHNVMFVNTYSWKKHPIMVLLRILYMVLVSKNVIIMTSVNGTRVLFKLASILKKVSRKKIYHIVVGGIQNVNLLKTRPDLLEIAKTLDGIYVEVPQMVKEYKEIGIVNIKYAPNGKVISSEPYSCEERELSPYKLCVYSKVNKEKGVPEAIEAVVRLNEEKRVNCQLDIYGVIDENYKEEFNELVIRNSKYVKFKGKIDRSKSLSTLSRYYVMLFPTHHPEGVPGAMIDAYEAGLPIIASNTFYIESIIHDGKTGLLFKEGDIDGLMDSIIYSIEHPDFTQIMRNNCRKEAEKYSINTIINNILLDMNIR